MIHPIYRHLTSVELHAAKLFAKNKDDEASAVINSFINTSGSMYNGATIEQGAPTLEIRAIMASTIMNTGFVNIDASRNQWYSKMSEKVIREIPVSEFKVPFSAGYIRMVNGGFMFYKDDDGIIVALLHDNVIDRIAEEYSFVTDPNDIPDEELAGASPVMFIAKSSMEKIGEVIDKSNYDRGQEAVVVSILSALMYVSLANAASDDMADTVSRKIVKGKKSAKRGVPSHIINVINVRQKRPSTESDAHEVRRKSDKMWVVRGHWRNQWYAADGVHKPKWIHPHFKGSGREVAQKVYRL